MEEGKKTSLKLLLQRKYGVEDTWVDTLTAQQVEDALIRILDCHTYDALKAQLADKKLNPHWTSAFLIKRYLHMGTKRKRMVSLYIWLKKCVMHDLSQSCARSLYSIQG